MSPEKPRVLLVSPFYSPNVGGVETHLDNLVVYLRQEDYKVLVVTYQPLTTRVKGLRHEVDGTVEIYRIPWFGHDWFTVLEKIPLGAFFYLVPGLLLFCLYLIGWKKRRVDVVHAQGTVAGFVGLILSKIFHLRSVVSTHTIYGLENRPIFRNVLSWIFNSYDRVLPVAVRSMEELKESGVPEHKMMLWSYWVDQQRFRPMHKGQCKEELGWEGRFVVLFVGRLIRIKGIEELLEATKSLPEGILVAFIGVGPIEKQLKQATGKIQNTVYVGKVGNELLPLYLNAADLLVVPSQYEEVVGRVSLEALSCSLPVIATNKGGLREIIQSSVGDLIDPTPANLAKAITNYFQNPQQLERLARNARDYALHRFSEKNAEVITRSYQGKSDEPEH